MHFFINNSRFYRRHHSFVYDLTSKIDRDNNVLLSLLLYNAKNIVIMWTFFPDTHVCERYYDVMSTHSYYRTYNRDNNPWVNYTTYLRPLYVCVFFDTSYSNWRTTPTADKNYCKSSWYGKIHTVAYCHCNIGYDVIWWYHRANVISNPIGILASNDHVTISNSYCIVKFFTILPSITDLSNFQRLKTIFVTYFDI